MAPTPVEQLFLEELNDARANPAAYGATIGVDLSYIPPAPPLTWDTRLEQAAALDAQDMNNRNFFGHVNPDGLGPGERIANAGYPAATWGESIAAGSIMPGPADALKDLIIDQGVPDLGHRNHLLGYGSPDNLQRQVGIGIVQGGSGTYQNYYVIDTGAVQGSSAFLTGVVYADSNSNGHYDLGEGLGGVTVTVAGVGSVTSFDTGGYSIPLAPGTYTVTASGSGLAAPVTRQVSIGTDNVRLDITPAPVPSNLGSLASALAHSPEAYQNFIRSAYGKYLARTPGATEVAAWVAQMQNGLSDERLEASFIGSAEYIANHGGPGAGWVTGMYGDLLGRAPSQAEVAGWVSALDKGMSASQVAYGFAASAEREAIRINGDYQTFLGRPAGQAEVNAWVSAFQNGASNENVIAGFAGSAEYFLGKGQASAPGWVGAAFGDVLGRAPSAGELRSWVGLLALPGNLGGAASALAHSQAYYQGFVQSTYGKYLARTPSATEVAGWVAQMQNGLSDETVEAEFIGSAEYIANHGGPGAGWVTGMYEDLLGRTPSQAEVAGWVLALNRGESPTQVAYGFTTSGEREGIRVNGDYQALLGRPASQAEINAWVSAFQNGASNEAVIAGFIASREYFDGKGQGSNVGWVDAAFHDLIGRTPSADELSFFVGMLS